MSDALAPRAPDAPAGREPAARQRLTFADRYAILRYKRQRPHAPNADIADALGFAATTIARVLNAHDEDVKDLTRQTMAQDIPQRLEEWAAASAEAALKGKHEPARDWLIAAGAIDPTPSATVNVGFSLVLAPRYGTPLDAVNEPAPTVVCSADAPALHAPAAQVAQTQERTSAPTLNAPAPNALALSALTVENPTPSVENPTHTTPSAQRVRAPRSSPSAPTRIRRSAKR